MEKQFVSYELAVKLKELGFDEQCSKAYRKSHFTLITGEEDKKPYRLYDLKTKNTVYTRWRENECTAPLWQQAFDWFREKHGLYLWIHSWKGDFGFGDGSGEIHKCHFKTYELARQACLEKLIELVKK